LIIYWSYIDTLVSGSPIIQDGKLVGAVTHVLVNDPTTGMELYHFAWNNKIWS
jgi:hypothetical protein